MFKKKNESGRSMVEMLGVLAIIGVLSIGGIAGYTMSMRKHRANQVVDLMTKYSLITYSSCQKQIADGEILVSNYCYGPEYADSGLHPISEVSYIGVGMINPNVPDRVSTIINFRDIELCKTVKSIMGSKDDFDCTGNGSKAIKFIFKGN